MANRNINAIELLTEQHEEVADLFEEFEAASNDRKKADLFASIADKLAIHARIEEEYFYPAVRAKKTEDMVLEAFVEHASIKRLLADLLKGTPGQAQFDAQMKVLKEQVEHHVQEEENELFPTASEVLDDEEILALAQEMAALQTELEEEGEPRKYIPEEVAAAEVSPS